MLDLPCMEHNFPNRLILRNEWSAAQFVVW